jgi:hypothetical protein
MTKTIALALALTLGCTDFAFAKDDDDDKISDADMAKVTAALADLGCRDPEGVKHEQEGASTRLTMPSARWARWTSSSTRISPSS